MRVLVNFSREDQPYLSILQYYMKQRRHEAIATAASLSLSELLSKAKGAGCDCIFLTNPGTLTNIVPDSNTKTTLDLYRGSRFNFSIPVVVGNPLAHTHSIDHGRFLLENDLKKLDTCHIPPADFDFEVIETQAQQYQAWCFLKDCALIAYDVETDTVLVDEEKREGGETIITCASWSGIHKNGEIKTFVLPFFDFLQPHYTSFQDHVNAIKTLQQINALPVPKVMHNGMYDSFHSIIYHAEPNNWTLDTMALHWCQYSSLPKSLDFVASITLPDYIQWKTQAAEASRKKDIYSYWGYNAKDTFNTLRICLSQLKALPAYARINYQHQFRFVYPFLYCGFEGIRINQDKHKEMRAKRVEQLEKSLADLRTMFANPNFNPNSPQQVAVYIYDVFGAADPKIGKKKTKEGTKVRKTRATDEKNLKAIALQHPILLKVCNALLSYREAAKAVSTYFDFLQKHGRLLYSINPFGTDSARASSSTSALWCGTQVQNQPPYTKEFLEADEDFELFEADNSQSEARCTAYLSQETCLIAALENKEKDFYKTLGFLFFKIPYEEVTKEFRNDFLKKIVHGTNYMMGAVTFIENATPENLIKGAAVLGINISFSIKPEPGTMTLKTFATDLLDGYHRPFPRVRTWYGEVKSEVATTHMLKSPLGWTRYFFGDILKTYQIFSSAVAHGPQNLSVHILNLGLWKIWQRVKASQGKIRLKAQIHDSVFLQLHKSISEQTKPLLLTDLDNPVVVHGRTLRIPVEYKDGTCWGKMIEHKPGK